MSQLSVTEVTPTTHCISDAWTSSFAHLSARCRPIADMDGVPTTSPSTGKSCREIFFTAMYRSYAPVRRLQSGLNRNPVLGYSILQRRGTLSFLGQISQNIIYNSWLQIDDPQNHILLQLFEHSIAMVLNMWWEESAASKQAQKRLNFTIYYGKGCRSKISIEIIRFRLSSSKSAAGHPKWRSKQLKLESCFVGSYSCQ